MKNIYEAIRLAVLAAIDRYRFVRHMQKGGCPDTLDF